MCFNLTKKLIFLKTYSNPSATSLVSIRKLEINTPLFTTLYLKLVGEDVILPNLLHTCLNQLNPVM